MAMEVVHEVWTLDLKEYDSIFHLPLICGSKKDDTRAT